MKKTERKTSWENRIGKETRNPENLESTEMWQNVESGTKKSKRITM
jgi:hypothetical protein